MLQTVIRFIPTIALILLTVAATHLLVSFAQTLLHRLLGHRRLGGRLFRNHVRFHHVYYARDHLVSPTYLTAEGNNTPYFAIPATLVAVSAYLVLPHYLAVVLALSCAASFYVHVLFDREYHVEGSWLQRFAWFRRKQALHFVHHRHANTNFAVVDFFWDRLLGTYRNP